MFVVTHAIKQNCFFKLKGKLAVQGILGNTIIFIISIIDIYYRQYIVIFICRTRKHHYQSSKTESRTSLDDWRRDRKKFECHFKNLYHRWILAIFIRSKTYFNDMQQIGWINQQQARHIFTYVLFAQLKLEFFITSCMETNKKHQFVCRRLRSLIASQHTCLLNTYFQPFLGLL